MDGTTHASARPCALSSETAWSRTLAEPNLTAVSGECAKFLAGGEYPIPVVDSNGRTSVTYKEFGVGVAFTPTVLSEGRISLKIETEVSELSNVGAVTISHNLDPGLEEAPAKSTVELPSGGSLALAGLLSDDIRQNVDGFPGLKDLPMLGTLFRSHDFIKNETELVVIVTPYLVRPTSRKELARPLDGLAEATDMRANFLGHLNRIYGKGRRPPAISRATMGSSSNDGARWRSFMTFEIDDVRGPRRAAAAMRLFALAALWPWRMPAGTTTARQCAAWTLVDPSQRHPILVSQQPQTMKRTVTRGSAA